MNDENRLQQVSELLDDELNSSQAIRLLQGLDADPELKKRWKRYSMISEAMRTSRVLVPDDDFVKRVSQQLESEPVSFGPRAAKQPVRDKIVTLALAASLGAVAIIVGKSVSDYPEVQGIGPVAQNTIVETGEQGDDARFRDYLVMHNETAYLSGAQGMLPYVRLASVKTGR